MEQPFRIFTGREGGGGALIRSSDKYVFTMVAQHRGRRPKASDEMLGLKIVGPPGNLSPMRDARSS